MPEDRRFQPGYWWYQFPRVDLTIDVDGTKVDYAFFFTAYARTFTARVLGSSGKAVESRGVRYVMAALQAAAYREGEIELNGKTSRVVLVDFNSNGRFDDEVQIRESSSGRASPVYGDLLLLGFDPSKQTFPMSSYDLMEHQVAKLASLGGELYDLEVAPGGDKLTLTPCAAAVGHVTLPSDGFRATVYSDKGLLKVSGDKGQRVPLAVGDWKLMSYTIDRTGYGQSAEEGEDSEESSLLKALAGALMGGSDSESRTTRIIAYGDSGSKALKIREGETVALPFGPPFKPVVDAPDSVRAGQDVRLGLSLLGSGGERCSSLMVDGKRPEEPKFTITTADGEEVESGKFKWG